MPSCSSNMGSDFSREVISQASGVVSLDGSTSMERVIGSLGESFCNQHTDIKFTYNPTGSGSGINAVRENRCDIGLSSRELKENEEKEFNQTVIAYDGIAVIVNYNNPLSDITLKDLADVYTGKITNWNQLGGQDAKIVVIGREAGSGTRDGFEAATQTRDQCIYRQELTSAGDIITAVAQNNNAIGYASFTSVKQRAKILKVDGAEISADNVISGAYPLRQPYLLITSLDRKLSDTAQMFFDYALSKEAAQIINNTGVFAANEK